MFKEKNMKIKFLLLVFVCLSSVASYAQSGYDTFRKQMDEMEAREKVMRKVLFDDPTASQAKKDSVRKAYRVFVQEKMELAKNSVLANPDEERFIEILNIYVRNFLTLDEYEEILHRFSPEVKKTEKWQRYAAFVTNERAMQVGKPCPEIVVKGHEGETIRLSELLKKNKIVLIDFWASWCGPCRMSLPSLKRMYEKYHDKGMEVLSVSLDNEKAAWDKAYKDEKLPWKDGSNLLGWEDPLVLQFAVRGIPHQLIVGSDGKILAVSYGEYDKVFQEYLK